MANRTRAVDEARRLWHQRRVSIGTDLRTARHTNGASQTDVGTAIGVSPSEVSRREHGNAPNVSALSLAEHAAAVGLRLAMTMDPSAAASGMQLSFATSTASWGGSRTDSCASSRR